MTSAHDLQRCLAGDVEVSRAVAAAEKKRKKKSVASKQLKPAIAGGKGGGDNRGLLPHGRSQASGEPCFVN